MKLIRIKSLVLNHKFNWGKNYIFEPSMKNQTKYTVAGLFSGCGGLDLGFINAGYEVIWANDFFKEAVDTYKKYW